MSDIITSKTAFLSRQVINGKKITLKDLNKKSLIRIRDTFLLVDISGSMSGEKMTQLKKALSTVYRPGIRVYAFSDEVYDVDEKDFLMLEPMSGTMMLEALEETWNENPRHIILATDGVPDSGPDKVLTAASQHTDIPIDTIGISDRYNSSYGYDPEFLKALSAMTGGKFNECNKPFELTSVIQNLLLGVGKSDEKGVITL